MPVRSNSRRLGGSLYRWVVLRLLRRRLHPEVHNARIKSTNSNKHTTHPTSQHQKQQKQQQQSIRLCGGGAPPTHGTGSPKENGESPSNSNALEENEFGVRRAKDNYARASRGHASSTKGNDGFQEVSFDHPILSQGASLPEIEAVKETAQFFSSTTQLESKRSDKGKFVFVREIDESYGPGQSHINSPSNAGGAEGRREGGGGYRRRRGGGESNPSGRAAAEKDIRGSKGKKNPSSGVDERTSSCGVAGPSNPSKSLQGLTSKKSSRRRENDHHQPHSQNAYPLLDVRGLEASSVQSLTTPAPTVYQHINSLRRWDSISVLYGIEYLLIRKKVHERLLCILRERRERRLRREVRESILSGGRPRKRSHKRKRKKKKGKGKHEKRKDVKTKNKEASVAEEKEDEEEQEKKKQPGVSSLQCDRKTVAHLECGEDVDKGREKQGQASEGRANGESSVIRKEGKKNQVLEAEEEEEESGEIRTRFDGSASVGSGDSRPSKSPSYHQVTSSEKSSSSSSYRNKSRETPTRDISPQVTTSLKTVSSDSSSSSTSSSATSSEEEEEEATSSPSAKSTGGPSLSTKTSPTGAYISDDESASERRRSSLYCCPCFVTFKRKLKKSRRRR